MISWEELLKNRKPVPSVANSAHMLECMKLVQESFPEVEIVQTAPEKWRLESRGEPMSHEYNSHYACWAEARELLNARE